MPATTSAAQAVTANPEQTIEIKKENEQKVDLVATNSNSSSVVPKVKPVKQFILKPTAEILLKDLKRPRTVNKKVWDKMTEAEKREQIQAIAQAEFDATNQAAMQALASRSNSIKRQSSSAKIDQEANTKKKQLPTVVNLRPIRCR